MTAVLSHRYQRGMGVTEDTGVVTAAGHILVLDDESSLAGDVARALRATGLVVQTADGRPRGLELALSRAYELVVLALRVPEGDGLVVLEELMRARPQQRLMVLSATAGIDVEVACLERGATDFVSQPFELSALVARVGAHVRRARAVGEDRDRYLRVGPITLDLQRRAVDRGAGSVALSAREFHLLRFFMLRAGRPCSREQLLAEVWETPFDTGTNVVDVYVHRLRQKLGRGSIGTLRNVGYLLETAENP